MLSFESTLFATYSSLKFLSTFKYLLDFAGSFPFLVDSSKLPNLVITFIYLLTNYNAEARSPGPWELDIYAIDQLLG